MQHDKVNMMSFMQSEVRFHCARLKRKWLDARNEHRRDILCPMDSSRVSQRSQHPGCPEHGPLTALLFQHFKVHRANNSRGQQPEMLRVMPKTVFWSLQIICGTHK